MYCRHCHRRQANGPRKLCRRCHARPAVRDLYAVEAKYANCSRLAGEPEPTAEEVERLIEQQLPTMPGQPHYPEPGPWTVPVMHEQYRARRRRVFDREE